MPNLTIPTGVELTKNPEVVITVGTVLFGLSKSITISPTNDTQYLQINSGTIALPTGDIASAGEVFTFLYQ